MRKTVLVIAFVVLAVMVISNVANGHDGDVKCPSNDTLIICTPGFPSGWWHKECRGSGGGWVALRHGCALNMGE